MSPNRSSGEWSIAVRQQAAVARIGQLGLKGLDLDDLLEAALRSMAEALGVADLALLSVRSESDLVGRAAMIGGQVQERAVVSHVRVPIGRGSLAGYTVTQGEAVVSPDLGNDDRFEVLASDYGVAPRAALAAPVGWGERPWGVITVYDTVVRQWTDDDVDFVQSMANTLGLAIERQAVEDELRHSSARLGLSLAAGGMGVWTWDMDADRLDVTASTLAIYGVTPSEFDGTSDGFLALVHPEDRHLLRGDVAEAVQTDGQQYTIFRLVRPGGEVRWVESWGRVLLEGRQPTRLVGVVSDITDRRAADELRTNLLTAEKRARAEAEAARERLAILADASDRFSATLDPDDAARALADVCVPLLADVCMVDVLRENGDLEEVAARARSTQSLADIRELRRRRAEMGGVGGLWSERRVAGRAESVLKPVITDEDFTSAAIDEGHLAILRRFGARSSVVVPMVARHKVIGVLTLMFNVTERHYDEDHMALVEELAARAALALDNGRLYASRNRVARSLQQALLPPALPEIDWLDVSARYRVAEADIEIGGDFYDVIEVGERAWGVVVGDVCGRGPDAAALTGLMRHSLRTVVVRERAPSRVLAQTNAAVLDQIDDARFCTATYLRVEDQAGGSVRVQASSAGHPRPVLLASDGHARFIDCSGVLLGVVPDPALVDVELTLAPGDAVVLYTDGVTEARRGRDLFGEQRLLEALEALAGQDADAIAVGLDRAVSAFQDGSTDDIAIVVVRVPPGPPH